MTLCLRDHDLDWREIDDEIVALDGTESVYLSVNGAGTLVWQLLAESATKPEIVEALVVRYGIAHDRAANDVDEFLNALNEQGLLAS